jgi:hypothetical protein
MASCDRLGRRSLQCRHHCAARAAPPRGGCHHRHARVRQRAHRCAQPGEDMTAATVRAPMLQPRHDRLSDIDRQRKPREPVGLATNNQLAAPPVDVRHQQRRRLTGTKPQPRQHGDHREVAAARHSVAAQLASSRATSAADTAFGNEFDGRSGADGIAPDRSRSTKPSTNRNRSRPRNGDDITFVYEIGPR